MKRQGTGPTLQMFVKRTWFFLQKVCLVHWSVVHLKKETKVNDQSLLSEFNTQYAVFSFYVDCKHELQKLISGYRLLVCLYTKSVRLEVGLVLLPLRMIQY